MQKPRLLAGIWHNRGMEKCILAQIRATDTGELFLQLFNLTFHHGGHLSSSRDEKPVHVEHCHLVIVTRSELKQKWKSWETDNSIP